eukprot:scaffold141103_cov102-Phaeocystis_antarctica.AAC.1
MCRAVYQGPAPAVGSPRSVSRRSGCGCLPARRGDRRARFGSASRSPSARRRTARSAPCR